MTNILISGILGHMGKNVYELAQADKDVCCVCGIDLTKTACDGTPVYDSFADVHEPVDVVIDFSSAANLANVLAYCKQTGCGASISVRWCRLRCRSLRKGALRGKLPAACCFPSAIWPKTSVSL